MKFLDDFGLACDLPFLLMFDLLQVQFRHLHILSRCQLSLVLVSDFANLLRVLLVRLREIVHDYSVAARARPPNPRRLALALDSDAVSKGCGGCRRWYNLHLLLELLY